MFERRKLLLVEDDRQEIENVTRLLRMLSVNYTLATNVNEALEAIAHKAYDFLLTDLHIETKAGVERPDGLLIINAAREQQPNITIVATSSDPRTEIWNEALAAGAHHFIRKPLSKPDEIVIAFGLARERKVLVTESGKTSKQKTPTGHWRRYADGYPHGIILGERELRRARGIAKRKDASFVIMGETGTGKEEVAKLIHRLRQDSEGALPFVAVNCATISGPLAESLLFGHRRGAFTGADQSTTGFIGEADGGILFLDEIQTLDLTTQQKLLRVLNDGTYNRLGETKTYSSQFQLIAASTKDLDDEVEAGHILLDIRTRMMGLDMHLLPLRERKEDIPALVALFLSKKGIDLTDEVFDGLAGKLQTFHWAGNLRQLFKALDAWILTCEFDELPLTVENFPIFKGMNSLQTREIVVPLPPVEHTDFMRALHEDFDFEASVGEFEKALIISAMKRHRSIGECCKALNLPRSTFDARRRKFGLL